MIRLLTLSALSLLCLSTGVAADKPTEVKIGPIWKGSIEDLELLQGFPEFVTEAKKFEKLCESWKFGAGRDPIDFATHVVVIAYSRGSSLDMTATLDEKGNLKVRPAGTKDLRPGFRFVVGIVKRDGVKSINGKELPKR